MKHKIRRRLTILIFFLLILSGIFFAKDRLISVFQTKKISQPFAHIKEENINKLIFENENKKTEIYKKNGHLPVDKSGWYLKKDNQEFKADEERLKKIIKSALSFKKEEIVSTNKNKHKDFGIDKQKVTLITKNKNYTIFVGHSAGISSTYVRLDEENDVFLAENLSDVFSSEDFRDLKIYFIDNEEKISSIEINFDGKQTFIEKKENNGAINWEINKEIAKKDRVDFFLNDLKTLKANDIFSKKINLFGSILLSIKIKESNKEKTAEFFEKDKENYYLKISTSDFIFQIPAAYVASLKKEEKDFTQ